MRSTTFAHMQKIKMVRRKRFDIGKLWKGRKQPARVLKKRSIAIKKLFRAGRWKPWNKNLHLSQEHREKLRQSNIFSWKNPSLKEKMSHLKKESWSSEKRKRKLSLRIKKFWHEHSEKLESMRKKIIMRYKTTDWEKEIGKALKKYYKQNPGARIKMRKKQKELYKNHPTMRRERQALANLYYVTHESERMRFLHYKAKKKKFYTALGIVKSTYEKKVADFLSMPEVREMTLPEYEPFTLYLENTKPIPDFFLRKLNVIVEVYGGHYKAWLRKVRKNKDYRKEKIPVISITPSELWNLKRYLLLEAVKLSKTEEVKNFNPEKYMKPRKEWLEKLKNQIMKYRR